MVSIMVIVEIAEFRVKAFRAYPYSIWACPLIELLII